LADIFISHVEEDGREALEIALGLEEAGYSTWTYEIDSVPGSSYLLKTRQEIDKSKIMIFLISRDSLSSSQIESEVIHAHEEHKGFIPLLKDVSFAEFKNRRPDYAQVIGARTTINIPKSGTGLLIPRLAEGLKSLGINPRSKSTVERLGLIRDHLEEIRKAGVQSPPSTPQPPPSPEISDDQGKPEIRKKTWPAWLKMTVLGVVVIVVAVGGILAGKLMSQSPPLNTPPTSGTPSVTTTNTAPASTAAQIQTTAAFSPPATPPGLTTSPSSQPANPVYGGIVKIYKHPPANLGYPADMVSLPDLVEAAPAIETLLRFDDSGQPAPYLASGWEFSSNLKSVTFTLNKGIKFHDDIYFNANSVQYNLDLFRNAKRPELQAVSSIDVIDDYTIRLNLKQFDAYLLPGLCEFAGAMISPTAVQKNGKEWCRLHPVGTGPFKFETYTSDPLNNFVRYVKFTGYRHQGKPYLDAIQFEHYNFGEISGAISKLDQKGYNIFLADDPSAVSNLQQSFNYSKSLNTAGVLVLIPDSGNQDSPFADIRVRQAAGQALDKQIIGSKAIGGLGKTTNQPEIPATVFYNPDITGTTYMPEQAKELLGKAGYPIGFKTQLIYDNHIPFRANDTIQVIKQNLAAIGIDATLVSQDDANFRQTISKGWSNGLVMDFIDAGAEKEPGQVFQRLFSSTSSIYPSVLQPKDYLSLLAQLQETPGLENRIQLNKQLLKMIVDDYCLLTPICTGYPSVLRSPSVRDLKMGETWVNQWTPENTWIAR
jgi:peptide/nickel transport system substrate-binding protein